MRAAGIPAARHPVRLEGSTTVTPSSPISCVAEAALPTRHGEFRIAVFHLNNAPTELIALFGRHEGEIPLVRLHSECLTGDTLGSLRCDCGPQLEAALGEIARAPYGILFYLRQEGRGIGLDNKIRAYALQDAGLDTVDANLALGLPIDSREYGAPAAVLRHLGVQRVRLLTNNPAKGAALARHGIEIVEQVPLVTPSNPSNVEYLRVKVRRMGHVLEVEERR